MKASKIFVAAPFILRERAELLAFRLIMRGYKITSDWVFADRDDYTEDWEAAKFAAMGLAAVKEADLLILICLRPQEAVARLESAPDALDPFSRLRAGGLTGGAQVELGAALGHGKPVILIGERLNVFHHFEGVTRFDTEDAFLISLDIGGRSE